MATILIFYIWSIVVMMLIKFLRSYEANISLGSLLLMFFRVNYFPKNTFLFTNHSSSSIYDINTSMTKDELIEKIINDGIAIADKIKAAKTVKEIESLDKEIKELADIIDDNFGIELDFDDEKENGLSSMLYMAAEEKIRQLEYYPEQDKTRNADTDYFLDYLLSRNWIDYKNRAEY